MNKIITLFLAIILCILSPVFTSAAYTEAELKALLLSNNLQLNQARGEEDLSVLDRKDARTGYGPTIDLEITGTYLANPMDTLDFVLPSSLGPPLGGVPLSIETGLKQSLYNFSLSLTQPVWTWGKLQNGVAMTEKLVEIRQKKRFALQKSLLAELQSLLYAQHYLLAMEELLQEQLVHSQALVSLVEESFANGMVLEEEVLSAKVSSRQIELAKVRLSLQRQRQRSAMGRLCNITLAEDDELIWTPDEQHLGTMLGYDLKTLQAMAIGKNQEQVRIATLMSELASLSTSIAKGSLYWKPDVAMRVSLEYGGAKFPFVEDDWKAKDDYTFNVSVGMKTTIWDGGKKFHEVRRNAVKESQAQLDMAQVYQAIQAQVEEAYLTLHLAHEHISYLQAKQSSLDAEMGRQQFLYDSGYGSEVDLLKAKLASLSAGFETEQQWLSYTGAFVSLNALCGVEKPLV